MSDKIRVLLVDDHVLLLDCLGAFLNLEPDIEVAAALSDGSHVSRVLQSCAVDVLILDIHMPYHGFEVLGDVQRLQSRLNVLILSSLTDQETMRTAITLGAEGFAFKTDPFSRIVDTIRQVARGQLVFPKEAQRWLMQPEDTEGESDELSGREMEVLSYVARGLTNSEIALKLSISKNTVGFHLKNIFSKLDVSNRTEATIWYFTHKSSFS